MSHDNGNKKDIKMKINKIIIMLSALILSGSYLQSGQRRSLGRAQVRTRTIANINKAIRAGNYPEADTLVKQLAPQMTAQDLEEVRSTINQRIQRTRSIQEKKPLEIIKQTVDTIQQKKEETVETQTKQEKEFSDVDISKATDYVKDYFTRSDATGHGYYLTRIYQYLEFLDTFQYRLEGDTFENIGKEFLKGTIAANKQSIRQAYEELLNTNDERTIMTEEAALLPALRELVKKAKETRNKSQLLIIPSDVEIPAIDKFDSEMELIKDRYPAQEIIETPSDILKERIDAYFKPTKADPQKPTHTFFTRRIKQLLDFLDIFHHRLSPGMKFADLGKDLPKWATQVDLREGYERLLKRNNKQQIMDTEPFLSLTLRNIISEAQKTKNKNNEFIIPPNISMPDFDTFDTDIEKIKNAYLSGKQPVAQQQPVDTSLDVETKNYFAEKEPKAEKVMGFKYPNHAYAEARIKQFMQFIDIFKEALQDKPFITEISNTLQENNISLALLPPSAKTIDQVWQDIQKLPDSNNKQKQELALLNILRTIVSKAVAKKLIGDNIPQFDIFDQEIIKIKLENSKVPSAPIIHKDQPLIELQDNLIAKANAATVQLDQLLKTDSHSILTGAEQSKKIQIAFNQHKDLFQQQGIWEKSENPSAEDYNKIIQDVKDHKKSLSDFQQWVEKLERLVEELSAADPSVKENISQDPKEHLLKVWEIYRNPANKMFFVSPHRSEFSTYYQWTPTEKLDLEKKNDNDIATMKNDFSIIARYISRVKELEKEVEHLINKIWVLDYSDLAGSQGAPSIAQDILEVANKKLEQKDLLKLENKLKTHPLSKQQLENYIKQLNDFINFARSKKSAEDIFFDLL